LTELRTYLESLPRGAVQVSDELVDLLGNCWEQFEGHDAERMDDSKLERMEEVQWDAPVMSFTIERHGGTVMGSSRADLHRWVVNLDEMTACCIDDGYRQIIPRQPPLKIEPIVDGLVQQILSHQEGDGIRWNKDGSVRVVLSKVLPDSSGYKRTLEGRRKRLAKALVERLAANGWSLIRDSYTFGHRPQDA
jgi:hypothetical protein